MKLGPNGQPMGPACLKRKHRYDADGVCERCGWKRTGIIGRPKRLAGLEGSARLAATLGVPAPAASSGSIFSSAPEPVRPDDIVPPQPNGQPAGAPPAADKAAALATTAAGATAEKKPADDKEPTKAARMLSGKIARKLTRLFDVGTDSLIEAFEGKDYTRVAGDADEEDLEDFEEALGEVIAQKIHDVEMGPGATCVLSAALILGDKCLGSKKIPKRPAISALQKAPEGTPATKPAPTPAPRAPKPDEDDDASDAGTTLSLIPLPSS